MSVMTSQSCLSEQHEHRQQHQQLQHGINV